MKGNLVNINYFFKGTLKGKETAGQTEGSLSEVTEEEPVEEERH